MHFSLQTFYNHFPEGQRTTAIFHLYKTAQVQNSFSTNASIIAIAYRLSNNAGGHLFALIYIASTMSFGPDYTLLLLTRRGSILFLTSET